MQWISPKFKNLISQNVVKNTVVICIICLTFLMCGAARVYISFLVPQLVQNNSSIQIDEEEASWLSSLSSLSNPLGFLLGGYMMDSVGRKWSTSCIFIPFIAGWALITCATNLNALYIGTSLHGVAAGMTMTASVYISEISVSEYRGFFLSILSISYMFGVVMCSVIHYILRWRSSALYFFIGSVLMFLSTQKLPESPYWLIVKGRLDDARRVLESIRNNKDTIKEEMSEIELSIIGNNPHEKVNVWISLLKAWKQIGILIAFVSLHKLTGFSALAQYTVMFFQQLKVPVDYYMAAVNHSVVSFLSTLLIPYFTHNFNRRSLLFVTSVIAGIFMSVTCLYEYFFYDSDIKPYFMVPILGIYGYTIATTIGITSISVILPGELLPTEITGISGAVQSISCSFINSFINKTYLSMCSYMGFLAVLVMFASCCFIIALLSITILPETRGKTLREIQDKYFPKRDTVKKEFVVTNDVPEV